MGKKRDYTMSEKALQQRREAAQQSTGPITEEGKAASSRNAWKHGLYSEANDMWRSLGSLGAVGTPCRTTCPKHPDRNPEHPCTLVLDGLTAPGKDCLDKGVYVQAFDTIMGALSSGDLSAGAHALMANQVAGVIDIITKLREAIAEHGVFMKRPMVTKSGGLIKNPATGEPYHELYINPLIKTYGRIAADMGINLSELMITPKSAAKGGEDDDPADAVADMFKRVLDRVNTKTGGRPTAIVDGEYSEIEEEDD